MGKEINIKLDSLYAIHLMNLLHSIEKAYKKDKDNTSYIKKISIDAIDTYHTAMRKEVSEENIEEFIEEFEENEVLHNELIKLFS